MYNVSKSCKLFKFLPVFEYNECESEFLEEIFEVVTVNFNDDGGIEYIGYLPIEADSNEIKQKIINSEFNLPAFVEEVLESKNWLKENVIKFNPFEIEDFMIYGIHETQCPQTDKIPVQVYAATAFGSEHYTTKMCLKAISWLYKNIRTPNMILDVGTGSGILSVAAVKIWTHLVDVIAVDIDDEAVDVTINNTITNNVENNIDVYQSDGYNNPKIEEAAMYDVIFANILANPLKMMASDAYKYLNSGGYYLISGFIENQEEDMVNYHLKMGFKLVKTYQDENWRAVILQK